MIYSNETVYENAVRYYKTLKKCNNKYSCIEKNVHAFFFTGTVYHRFDKVEKMFSKIINIEFPNYEKLHKLLHKRNNIVHRFSFSSIDRMEMVNITLKDIINLTNETNRFVDELIANVKKCIQTLELDKN